MSAAVQALSRPQILIIKNAGHVALYDRMDKIPFDAITEFFAKNLK